MDELDALDLPDSAERVEWYFTTPRPPLLTDFLDERLTKSVLSKPSNQMISLELEFGRFCTPPKP
jgi:hypothetical protein